MLEQLSQRARFRQWLQDVAAGNVSEYPEPSNLPRDARIMLESEDTARRELRQLRGDMDVLRKRLAELVEADVKRSDEELVRRVADRLREARRASFEREVAAPANETQIELDRANDRIAQLEAELAQARQQVEAEQNKLLPVVRYAYRLRRLVQSIFGQDQLTDEHRARIVDLLKAGGVPVDGDRQSVTRN